jgi:hypothetical protein
VSHERISDSDVGVPSDHVFVDCLCGIHVYSDRNDKRLNEKVEEANQSEKQMIKRQRRSSVCRAKQEKKNETIR